MTAPSDPFVADVERSLGVIKAEIGCDPERALVTAVMALVERSRSPDDPDEEGAPLWTLDRPVISQLRQAFHTIAGVANLASHPDIAAIASERQAEIEAMVGAANGIMVAARQLRRFMADADRSAADIGARLAAITAPMPEEPSIVIMSEDVDDEVVEAMRSEIDGHIAMISAGIDVLREDPGDRSSSGDLARIAQSVAVAADSIHHAEVASAAGSALRAVEVGTADEIAAAFDAVLAACGMEPQFAASTPSNVDGWSFDAQPVQAAESGDADVTEEVASLRADELVCVFVDEYAVALPRLIAGCASETIGDAERVCSLGRIWHTMKGSAAQVGLGGISRICKLWEDALEHAADPAAVTGDILASCKRDAILIGSALGIDRAVAESAALLADEFVTVFRDEFSASLPRLLALCERVAAGDVAAIRDLGRGWHTVKGSASQVGLGGIARIGKGWEDAFERTEDVASAAQPDAVASCRRDIVLVAAALGLERRVGTAKSNEPSADPGGVEEWNFASAMEQAKDEPASESTDFSRLFAEELGAALPSIAALLQRMAGGEPGARSELVDIAHRIKGSAITACPGPVSEAAQRAWTMARDSTAAPVALAGVFAALASSAGVPWTPPERLGATTQHIDQAVRQAVNPVPVPAGDIAEENGIPQVVIDAFLEEAMELMDEGERISTLIDDDQDPKSCLRELMRIWHTVKGGARAAGFMAFGNGLHAFESGLERWIESAVLPPPAKLGAAVRAAHSLVAAGFSRIRIGRQAPDVSAEIASALRVADMVPGQSEPTSPRAVESGPAKSGGSTLSGMRSSADRRFIRVPVDTLDAVMGIAGELVTARSRFMARIAAVRPLQIEMQDGQARMQRLVSGFHERNGFTLRRRRREASAPGTSFGDLEMDRYDDVNILSRQIIEIADDVFQAHQSIVSILDAFGDDNKSFSGLVSDLQGRVTAARMIPAQALFDRLRMPIRDAAATLGKDVAVAVSGGDVALDKATIEGLQPPMLHLVRNAVAHGIETADLRRRCGKDPRGTVSIAASQDAGRIVITVRDDGAGLDLERMRRIGLERGLIDASAADHEVAALVFSSGFSTKDAVDEVSGRGVGGDVAKSGVERLGGRITVETQAGKGTVFTIVMPLTMAITRALIVKDGGSTFAVPASFVVRVISGSDDPSVIDGCIVMQGPRGAIHLTPAALGSVLGGAASSGSAIVVLRVGDAMAAISVDTVLGQEEVVIKPLDAIIARNRVVSGLTVDSEGRIIPVLDAPGIIDLRSHAQSGSGRPDNKARESVQPGSAARSGLRILFADDASSVRKVAEKFLSGIADLEVVFAVDGVDAFAKLSADPKSFDMVFTDLEMPRMNGFDLIRDMRRDSRFRLLPVAVVTSRTGKKHRDEAIKLGANEYIGKPFTKEILEDAIRRYAVRQVTEPARV